MNTHQRVKSLTGEIQFLIYQGDLCHVRTEVKKELPSYPHIKRNISPKAALNGKRKPNFLDRETVKPETRNGNPRRTTP
jgi:hypothetical protein